MTELKSEAGQVRLQKKFKKCFYYDTKELFEPITNPVSKTSGKFIKESETIFAANANDVKSFPGFSVASTNTKNIQYFKKKAMKKV